VPAPVRFLPEYDNLLFAHADRTRINPANHMIPLFPGNGAALGYFLLDGVWSGLWRLDRTRTSPAARNGTRASPQADSGTARLIVQHFGSLPAAARNDLTAEGLKLLAFLSPGAASPEIHITPAS
jgi:Winged helix DNA-binding domain